MISVSDELRHATHEAGHVIAAHILGATVLQATIEPESVITSGIEAAGEVLHTPLDGMPNVERRRKEAAIALCGFAAVAVLLGITEDGIRQDVTQACRYTGARFETRHGELHIFSNNNMRYAYGLTIGVVDAYHEAIRLFARALIAHRTITQSCISSIIAECLAGKDITHEANFCMFCATPLKGENINA